MCALVHFVDLVFQDLPRGGTRLDNQNIGVRSTFDFSESALRVIATGFHIESHEMLGKSVHERALADSVRSSEEKGLRKAPNTQRSSTHRRNSVTLLLPSSLPP